MAAARAALRRILILICPIAAASCLLDGAAERRSWPVQFELLALPSHVAVGDSAVVDLVFGAGPSACWQLASLGATVQGNVIEINGTAFNPNPELACIEVRMSDTRLLKLPPLSTGRFVVKAGALVDTMDVGAGVTGLRERIVFIASIDTVGQGCGVSFFPRDFDIALSGLPPDLVPHYYLVRGGLSSEDPCGLQATHPVPFDYFVSVHELTPR